MHSSSRNGAKVIWLGVHTTEGMMRATALRDWTGWAGSSHAASDETGALLTPADGFVPYDRAAWTLRNGNPISENIAQCGWARWTRAEWLARPKLLDATARWLADRSKARGIPLVRLSAADIRARKPGVIGHGDYSTATGDGTHWDPGPGYPWDVVLAKATTYRDGIKQEDDMANVTDDEKALLIRAAQRIEGFLQQRFDDAGNPARALDSMDGAYLGQLIASGTSRTVAEVSAAFHQEADRDAANQAAMSSVMAASRPAQIAAAIPADLAKQVADELAKRMAS